MGPLGSHGAWMPGCRMCALEEGGGASKHEPGRRIVARQGTVVPSEAEFRLALRLGLEANCLQRMLLTTDADLWDLDRPLCDVFRMITDGQWRPCHVGALETREVVA